MSASDWRSDVLKFWFGLQPKQWWDGGPELDHRIRQNFLKLWTEKRQLPVDAFLSDPLTANAAVILFDQFPRNMFRGHADAYSTDHLALAISKGAIAKGFDEQLQTDERKFLYMPFYTARISTTRTGQYCCSPKSATTSRSATPRSTTTSSRASAASRTATPITRASGRLTPRRELAAAAMQIVTPF